MRITSNVQVCAWVCLLLHPILAEPQTTEYDQQDYSHLIMAGQEDKLLHELDRMIDEIVTTIDKIDSSIDTVCRHGFSSTILSI